METEGAGGPPIGCVWGETPVGGRLTFARGELLGWCRQGAGWRGSWTPAPGRRPEAFYAADDQLGKPRAEAAFRGPQDDIFLWAEVWFEEKEGAAEAAYALVAAEARMALNRWLASVGKDCLETLKSLPPLGAAALKRREGDAENKD